MKRRDWVYAHLVYWPTLAWNFFLARVLNRRHWWDRIEDGLYLGARPLPGDARRLADLGVRGIVNTCEEFRGYPSQYQALGIKQLWIPTVDFTHPNLDDVNAAIAFMNERRAAGETIYVHCKAGRARSATIVLCYLIASRGMQPQAAMDLMLAARPHINPKLLQRPVVQQVIALSR